jgi:hypothetical protein
MPLLVYTAVNCGRDAVLPVSPVRGVRFVCFHDSPSPVPGWEMRRMTRLFRDPQRTNRWYKLHPHLLFPRFRVTVWLDANLRPRFSPGEDPDAVASAWLAGRDWATSAHPERDCVYDEAEICRSTWRETPEVLDAQMARYRAQGHPPHAGLFENSVLVRRFTPAVAAACAAWWDEIAAGSARDQLSLPPVLRRLGLPVSVLPAGTAGRDPHLAVEPHPFQGHPARRAEHLAEISRLHGAGNPDVARVAGTLAAADAALAAWEREFDAEDALP